ncbi:ricin-type beta-trefoil lectin domain protein [Actinosynnema pretiosum subsp. pretiosum]|uniref:Alpha-galactosidase n=1 Tax=Actinosynnema pretiosum subsp. pretiosum TaxID=103721 RepID=A0AA45L772_9PSEU|nr:Alpha-galactosidase precursor [Actinosynnema pretiosum subsp. pretiosum]QUF04814.1 ricin-type beta-trefoil lectin domain protein [Actinosynnema pretiosum subsp. pretiosum]
MPRSTPCGVGARRSPGRRAGRPPGRLAALVAAALVAVGLVPAQAATGSAEPALAAAGAETAGRSAPDQVAPAAGSPADVRPAAPGSPATTPPMGWNSWNTFGCNISESTIRDGADALVSSGMRDAGYQYVVVDDCWFDVQRLPDGSLRGDPTRFPSGMKALGDYIHARGLKFGIYQVPTDRTCAQRGGAYPGSTGSVGHEELDARTFASWGVDYLKYDWCSPEGDRDEQVARFALMRDALRATGRPIVYSINPNSYHAITGSTYDWGEVADLWRTTEDLLDIWRNENTNSYPMGVVNVVDVNAPLAAQAGPGRWNDPDMLVVGRPGLTTQQSRAHFALWALMAAPLMAGNDVRAMPAEISSILRTPGLVAVNQDALGAGGRRVRDDGDTEVFAKPLADGSVAVGLFNRGAQPARISAGPAEVGLAGTSLALTDLWTGATSTGARITADVPSQGVAAFRVTGAGPLAQQTGTLLGVASRRCLDVPGAVTTPTARPALWACHGAANQLWTLWQGGEVRIYGAQCLDLLETGGAPGTPVVTALCDGRASQRWTRDGQRLVSTSEGTCLDARGVAAGTAAGVQPCDGRASQRWLLS